MHSTTTAGITGIDTHAHIFRRGLPLSDLRRYTPDYDASVNDFLAHLASAGLSHGVLVQPSFLGTDNRFMLDALLRHGEQLRGIAVVDPALSDEQLAVLDACGVVGVRFNLIGQPVPDWRAEPWAGLLRKLAQRNWLVELHRPAQDLLPIARAMVDAGVRVVIDHFGRPDPHLGIGDPGFRDLLSVAATGRVWVKLSAAYRNHSRSVEAIAMARMLRESFGSRHLLWGSDWPHTQFEAEANYGDARAVLDQWLPDAAVRHDVLVASPAELFGFG